MTEKIGQALVTPSEAERIRFLRESIRRAKIRKGRNSVLALGVLTLGGWFPNSQASGYTAEAVSTTAEIARVTKKITPLKPAFGWATYHDGVKDAEGAINALKWECIGHSIIPDEWKKYPNGREAREKLSQLADKTTKVLVFDPQGPKLSQQIEDLRNKIPDSDKVDPPDNECWDANGEYFPKKQALKNESNQIGEIKKIITDRIDTITPTIPQEIQEQVAKGEINAALTDIKAKEDILIKQKNELITKKTEAINSANSWRGLSYGFLAIGACAGVAILSGTLINRVNEDRQINRTT